MTPGSAIPQAGLSGVRRPQAASPPGATADAQATGDQATSHGSVAGAVRWLRCQASRSVEAVAGIRRAEYGGRLEKAWRGP